VPRVHLWRPNDWCAIRSLHRLVPLALNVLLSVDDGTWLQEARSIHEHLTSLGDHVPARLWDEYHALLDRLLDRAP
jgi:hypothetical protein